MTAVPKPSHLSGEFGAWFKDPLIAAAYPARPPYPEAAIALLAGLAVDAPRAVLDVGCGTGDVARRLAPLVERVDAVDFSAAMMERGRHLPGGQAANLHWILGALEDVELGEAYALVTAGESLHWMDWPVVLPRFAELLSPNGVLAIVERNWERVPAMRARLLPIVERYSPVRNYVQYDLVALLEQCGLFTRLGRQRTEPEPWLPTIDDYLECRYSQRGLSRTHMGPAAVSAFDTAIRVALAELCEQGEVIERDGRLQLTVDATITWGKAARGAAAGPLAAQTA
jgi:SAM-dependent methyltransferase